jgi:hypothetical protein
MAILRFHTSMPDAVRQRHAMLPPFDHGHGDSHNDDRRP